MRHLQFTINDGRTMDLEVTTRLEDIVAKHCGYRHGETVTDADIKRFFLESLAKAGE
jgi:hypothetical protein